MDKIMSKLYRSQRDRKIFGICGGLSERFNIDATLLRLMLVVTAFFSAGTVIPIYIIAGIVIPKENVLQPAGFQQSEPVVHFETGPSSLDEMMKDVENKAMKNEIEQLRAKIAKYEKGDV